MRAVRLVREAHFRGIRKAHFRRTGGGFGRGGGRNGSARQQRGRATPLSQIRLYFDIAMFFGTGVFAIFPLYIPALFPTLLRTTGAGFCYNFGRLVAGIGTLVGGTITAKAGGPALAVWWVGFLYIPGVVLSLFMPEVPYKEEALHSETALAPG